MRFSVLALAAVVLLSCPIAQAQDAPKTVAPKTVAPKTVVPKTVVPKTVVPKTVVPKTVVPQAIQAAPHAVAAPAVKPATQPQNGVVLINGRYSFRTAGGQWLVWQQGQWQLTAPDTMPGGQRTAAAPYTAYRYSAAPPSRGYSARPYYFESNDEARPELDSALMRTANGHWYLNGRGYFSD